MKSENYILVSYYFMIVLFWTAPWTGAVDESQLFTTEANTVSRLVKDVLDDFLYSTFVSQSEQAQLLSHFIRYRLHHRLGNNLVLFNIDLEESWKKRKSNWHGSICHINRV